MTLQRLESFTVFQTDDVILRHRFLYRDSGRQGLLANMVGAAGDLLERGVDLLDETRELGTRQRVLGDIGCDDIGGHADQAVHFRARMFCHFYILH